MKRQLAQISYSKEEEDFGCHPRPIRASRASPVSFASLYGLGLAKAEKQAPKSSKELKLNTSSSDELDIDASACGDLDIKASSSTELRSDDSELFSGPNILDTDNIHYILPYTAGSLYFTAGGVFRLLTMVKSTVPIS
jgi:hypothetical protein